MKTALRENRANIAVVFGVLLLFLANGSGLFKVIFGVGGNPAGALGIVHSPDFLLLLAEGVVLAVALPLLSPIPASLLTLAACAPVFYMNYAHTVGRPLVPMEFSLLTIMMLFVINVVLAYYRETHSKQQIIDVFGQYVPPEVVERIRRDPQRLSMEADSRELSILFCDVQSFTAISERLEPKELAQLLNALFTPLSEILYRHGAVIDKYMGDAVMAFWGAPLPEPNHAAHAVAAAFEIQDAVAKLGDQFEARGWPRIQVGIGINTGIASVGNMGSAYRVAYTAIGDVVNVAARLQDLTRIYHTPIIVGASTRKAFPAATYRELGLVQVKGKTKLARIYEPCNPRLDPDSTIVASMHRHNEALRCYYAREWETAKRLFALVREQRPGDPVYDFFLRRIADFEANPPPDDWRGEVRYTVK